LIILIIILGEEYELWCSSLCSFLQPPVTFSLFGPNFSSTPCSQIPSVCSSLNVRDKFRTHTESLFLYILISTRLDSRREDRRFWTEW
jgi:hypothetical protein